MIVWTIGGRRVWLHTIEALFIQLDDPLEYTVPLIDAHLRSWGRLDRQFVGRNDVMEKDVTGSKTSEKDDVAARRLGLEVRPPWERYI